MSAILAAASDLACLVRTLRTLADLGSPTAGALVERHERDLIAAGRAIVAASNAAGAGRVVEGAPRTWAVRWSYDAPTDAWFADVDDEWAGTQIAGPCPSPMAGPGDDVRPTWDAANRLWLWGTAAHDPRPCAWPRPFARGADR